ncbi:MAG: OmpA family protein [Alphaproteobacteria bacterium]|nr:OmpA family protein [Alphaproteobacteria bacterium]
MATVSRLLGALAALSAAALSAPAFAQDEGADIDRFRPPADSYGYLGTQSAETLGHLQLGLGAWFNYAHNPLVMVDSAGERVSVTGGSEYGGPVQSRLSGDLHLGMGVSNYFSLAADLPIVLTQTGYDLSTLNDFAAPASLQGNALGDLRITPKIAPVSRDDLPLGLALVVPVSVPTGNPTAFTGAGGVSVAPTLAVEFSDASVWSRLYRWRVALNLGYAVRPASRVRDVEVNNALLYSAAVGFRPTEPIELMLDVQGESWGGQLSQSPLEVDLGSKFLIGQWTSINVGAGLGILPGLGTPDFRIIAGAAFAPSFDANARDSDKDGVSDGVDQCPKHAEDKDGYQDEDGCPELDNDGDGVEDDVDQCVNDPEDDDGYRDLDGCPDSDNDMDQIPDMSDRCPDEAETVNGFEDEDGCPDEQQVADSDGDGYPDDIDRCPYDAEDLDDFDDTDGCPDEDNDRDGILDVNDECPDNKETYNGTDDEDGCPDEGRVKVKADRIEISDKIYFESGKATIKRSSYSLLDEIATVIKANPQIKKIRIEGHTDADGSDVANLKLSQDRAKAVMDYLVEAGVEAGRLSSAGFGESVPIADNDTPEGKAQNRRVEFLITAVE